MFLGPLEAMKPWNPRGIEGVYRFLQKLWRLCVDPEGNPSPKITDTAIDSGELLKVLHETIRKVGEDIENLRYNTSVSQMMILVNQLQKASEINRSTITSFLKVLAPFAPHITEELWSRLGQSGSITTAPWPSFDQKFLTKNESKLVFQINGKHRGDKMLPIDISQETAIEEAKAHPKVVPHLKGKAIKRVIYVPGRILNLVVA